MCELVAFKAREEGSFWYCFEWAGEVGVFPDLSKTLIVSGIVQ